MMRSLLSLLPLLLPLLLLSPAWAERIEDVICLPTCQSDLDCSLNGECVGGACVCEVAWTGSCCQFLDLLPVPRASSYRAPNVSTWGGNIVTLDNTTFHMWIAEMAPDPVQGGSCGLTTWSENSQITHVTAASPLGPYQRREVAVGVWSHNPIVRVDPQDGTLVMWHIGSGSTGGVGAGASGGADAGFKGYCAHNGTSPCGEQSFDKCTPYPLCAGAQLPGWTCYPGVCSGDSGGGKADGDCGPDLSEPTLACNMTAADCARAAAAACDATPSCESFGMSDNWLGLDRAKLFARGTAGLTPNGDWCVWVRNTTAAATAAAATDASTTNVPEGAYDDMYARARKRGTHPAPPRPGPDGGCTLQMHTASSPAGPWVPYTQASITPCGGNNPAPFFHPNGTLYIVFTDQDMGLWRADTWRGPYTLVTQGACGGGEDPSLYVDARGRFHCLFHRAPFSNPDRAVGHAYSLDGRTWRVAQDAAANSTIVYEGLGAVLHGKRERPHPAFNARGEMTQLVTGVCITPRCDPLDGGHVDPAEDCSTRTQYYHCDANSPGPGWYDRTYTLVQAVRTA